MKRSWLIVSSALRRATRSSRSSVSCTNSEFVRSSSAWASHNSVVRCERLHSIPQADVRRIIGHLSDALMLKIDDCLKAALGLP